MQVLMSPRRVVLFAVFFVTLVAMAQTDQATRPGIPRSDMQPVPLDQTSPPPTLARSADSAALLIKPERISPLGSNGLSLVGNIGYSISGSSVQLTADRVENASTTRTSGTLQLWLWMSENGFRGTGYKTAVYQFPNVLLPLQYYYNIAQTVPFTLPPTGCYYVSMLLEEYQASGAYAYADYLDFSNRVSVNHACDPVVPPCTFTLNASSASFGSAASAGSVSVSGSPNRCSGGYSATSNDNWIVITGGANGSGSGSHVLSYSISPNGSFNARNGSMTIAGHQFVITQAGMQTPCSYTISPQSATVAATGGSGSLTVTGGPPSCTSGGWNAFPDSSWISVNSGGSGTGSGSVALTYSVASNTSPFSRSGTINIAGQIFTITQPAPNTPPPGCTSTETSLCLNSRFVVSAMWQTSDGSRGAGHAVPLTSDTGYFWFFSATNVEMVLKVLNGCALSQRYWVFAGGLTNVNVTVTVRDTITGMSKIYTNPPNTAFQPIQDTGAFATCQ